MTKASIKIEFVEGQLVTPRRGIAFLVHEDEKHVDGKSIFDKLVGNDEKFIMASMKAWIDGAADIAGRFHGFPGDTTFRDGYVFK